MPFFKRAFACRGPSLASQFEGRLVLRIGVLGLALAAVVVAGTFVPTPSLPPDGSILGKTLQQSESGSVDIELVGDILERGDVRAVYQVLGSYDRLHRIAKSDFWAAVAHLSMTELIPFAEAELQRESDPDTRRHIEQALTILRAHLPKKVR